LLIENDLAVYSSHLPLDAHPKLGNNALLCRALGFKKLTPFFVEKGRPIGWKTVAPLEREALTAQLAKVLGAPPKILPGGPGICRHIGIVTGGAGSQLEQAAKEGVDTFITGEGPHWSFATAEHLGINVFYGGHYATETFGVKALASALARKYGLSWIYLDHPTGL
jgi:putative NIF3 family GTP cyclohydrolase 1 type 2